MTSFNRTIGRWAMSGLVINAVVGAGIFGLPGELSRLLGKASPIAMLAGAFTMAIIVLCMTEVASQFSEAGGAYLFTRRAFGPFMGLQVGWFWLLGALGGAAACANLFLQYVGALVPSVSSGFGRIAAITVLIAVPATANYFGVSNGSNLANLFTVAKTSPMFLVIVLGFWHFANSNQPKLLHWSEIASPATSGWITALLLLLFAYGGYEDVLVPMGEVVQPRKTVPFGIFVGLAVTALLYTSLQFVTVATLGNKVSDRPLADAAHILLGDSGTLLITITVMISTYGWIAGSILNAPRLPYAFAANGEFPTALSRLHPRYKTPTRSIVLFSCLVWILAVSGTFLWLVTATAGSMAIMYGSICAALIRLRKIHPSADAFRVPFATTFACVGIGICCALLSQLNLTEILLMCCTSMVALAHWWWTRKPREEKADVTSVAA